MAFYGQQDIDNLQAIEEESIEMNETSDNQTRLNFNENDSQNMRRFSGQNIICEGILK